MNKLGKVSNVTNSSDPQMINSRVFVGNLNTFAVTKEDVERLFKRYGRIYGISMHKGYAFVQFCNEYDARNAVAGEEGRVVAGQALDVNMVSEPKPNRPTRKRQAGGSAAGVSDWDFFYDTGYSHAPPRPAQMHGPPMKRARSDALTVRRELVQVRPKGKGGQPAKRQPASLKSSSGPFIQYNVSDVLICGNCKEQFANIEAMTTHRKTRCKLRFACKCQELADKSDTESGPFHCASCKEVLPTLWDAVFHAQNSHNVKVVVEQLKEKKEAEEQDNVVPGGDGDGAGNHEGEASGDSHNIEESGDGNDAEGEFENDDGQEFGEAEGEGDGDAGEDDAVLQDDAEGVEGADSAE